LSGYERLAANSQPGQIAWLFDMTSQPRGESRKAAMDLRTDSHVAGASSAARQHLSPIPLSALILPSEHPVLG